MTDIPRTIDPSTIAGSIEANLNAYLLSYGSLPGGSVHDSSDVVWADSGVPVTTFNSAVQASLTPETADAAIESVIAHFRERSLPFTWHVGPSSTPADLTARLLAAGLSHDEDEPGMAIEIARAHRNFPYPPGLTIERVADRAGLRDWVETWACGVPDEYRDQLCRRYVDVYQRQGLGPGVPWSYYLARIDGVPVGNCKLYLGEEVAAVHHVVTVHAARRRGIGTAMTLRLLDEALDRGYRVAVLSSSPLGLGSYSRIGFKQYCHFGRYLFDPGL